jgi:hypothetical protein
VGDASRRSFTSTRLAKSLGCDGLDDSIFWVAGCSPAVTISIGSRCLYNMVLGSRSRPLGLVGLLGVGGLAATLDRWVGQP